MTLIFLNVPNIHKYWMNLEELKDNDQTKPNSCMEGNITNANNATSGGNSCHQPLFLSCMLTSIPNS
jgi:hypothetical protein